MSLINIKNLTFRYPTSDEEIFSKVSLQIDTDWRLALVGRNGKGKTTLLKLLKGELDHQGSIFASVNFEYYPFFIENKDLLLGEIIEENDPSFEEWKIKREGNLLGIENLDFYRQFSSYSGGEQTKILLAVLFSKDNAFLLIDEPTNHLDRVGRQAVAKYLGEKKSFILVSHDKKFVDNCVDHILSINRSDIVLQSGNLSSYLENKQRQDDYEQSLNDKLKEEISKLGEASKRTAMWSDKCEAQKFAGKGESGLKPDRGYIGAKSAKIMKRATSMKARMEKSIDEASSLLKNIERQDDLRLRNVKFFSNKLLEVSNLVVAYEGKAINQPLSFSVEEGERISLTGKNGCGKTSIIKAILGQIKAFSGEANYNLQLKISYASQDTSFLRGSFSQFCSENEIDKTFFITMLAKLGVNFGVLEKDLSCLSEGEKKKLVLAKSLSEEANLYVWDEPLNFIDIIAREQLTNMLISCNASMIFVEHDAEFADKVATKVVTIS